MTDIEQDPTQDPTQAKEPSVPRAVCNGMVQDEHGNWVPLPADEAP